MILHELIAYDTLRLVWWALLGVLLVGFAVMDGFDLGTAALLPFVARTDLERRVVINSVGPVWEGNQVWLVVGAGSIFAAWPPLYGVAFSGFYVAMLAALVPLILRPVAFKFRSKHEDRAWRSRWDRVLCIAGIVPAAVFGVAMGNVLQGVPFRFAPDMRVFYEGGFIGLLNPFALLAGAVSLAMLLMHGAAWLQLKTDATVQLRARRIGIVAALATGLLYVVAGVLLATTVEGYEITSAIDPTGPSNPLLKTVVRAPHAWFANQGAHPGLWMVPALGVIGALLAAWAMAARRELAALLCSGLAVSAIVASVGVSVFPFLLPSSLDPAMSLTVWDASSSHLTLFVMLVVTAIFLPLIVAYTSWVYAVLRGKVDAGQIEEGRKHAY